MLKYTEGTKFRVALLAVSNDKYSEMLVILLVLQWRFTKLLCYLDSN